MHRHRPLVLFPQQLLVLVGRILQLLAAFLHVLAQPRHGVATRQACEASDHQYRQQFFEHVASYIETVDVGCARVGTIKVLCGPART